MISTKYHTSRLSIQLILAGVGWMGIGAVLVPAASGAEAPVPEAALPAISRSLHQHPDVTAANARVCQAIHRLGLSRAQSRPQISLSISGGRQLLERIKGQNGRPDRRGAAESGLRTIPASTRTIRRPGANGQMVTSTITMPERRVRDNSIDDDDISGAHKRDYAHRARNHVYDGTVSVRYNLVDWGQSRAAINAERLRHQVSRFDAETILAERTYQLLGLGLRLTLLDDMLAAQATGANSIAKQADVVAARVRAGAGRLSDLREVRLLALDGEIEQDRLRAERDRLLETLAITYELAAPDLAPFLAGYRAGRPDIVPLKPALETGRARSLRLQMETVLHEERQIKGARWLKIDAVIDGTVFDLADYEDEYEVVGKLEFKMPLYDGGTSRARLRETAWRSRELRAALHNFERKYSADLEQNNRRFEDLARAIAQEQDRRDELRKRLASLIARQGQTVSSPVEIANLYQLITRAETRLVELAGERELTRAHLLFLTEALNPVLNISRGEEGC